MSLWTLGDDSVLMQAHLLGQMFPWVGMLMGETGVGGRGACVPSVPSALCCWEPKTAVKTTVFTRRTRRVSTEVP